MSDSLKYWEELLSEDPSNELLRFTLAKKLLDQKKWAEALIHFQKLVDDQEDYALAWAYLARCFYELGQWKEARQAGEVGLKHTRVQKHEVPEDEILAIFSAMEEGF